MKTKFNNLLKLFIIGIVFCPIAIQGKIIKGIVNNSDHTVSIVILNKGKLPIGIDVKPHSAVITNLEVTKHYRVIYGEQGLNFQVKESEKDSEFVILAHPGILPILTEREERIKPTQFEFIQQKVDFTEIPVIQVSQD